MDGIWEKHLNMCVPVPSPRPSKLGQQPGKTGFDTSVEKAREREDAKTERLSQKLPVIATSKSCYKPSAQNRKYLTVLKLHRTTARLPSWGFKICMFWFTTKLPSLPQQLSKRHFGGNRKPEVELGVKVSVPKEGPAGEALTDAFSQDGSARAGSQQLQSCSVLPQELGGSLTMLLSKKTLGKFHSRNVNREERGKTGAGDHLCSPQCCGTEPDWALVRQHRMSQVTRGGLKTTQLKSASTRQALTAASD